LANILLTGIIVMNGSLDTSDVLLNRGLNGGYGFGGHGGSYGREFANDGSNAVRIGASEKLSAQAHEFNRDSASNSHDSLSQQISDQADRNRDLATAQAANAANISARDLDTQIALSLSQQIARGEDNQNNNFNMLAREAAANAREAAKCCCEAKVLAVQNQAKTDAGLAQILANQACDTRVGDAVANAQQNAKLDAILADNGRGHHRGN
jgi:hypothetical protein